MIFSKIFLRMCTPYTVKMSHHPPSVITDTDVDLDVGIEVLKVQKCRFILSLQYLYIAKL